MNNDGAFGLAMMLAALAGWVDAAGLGISGHLFLSFMSGNTTDLAAALVHQHWSEAGTTAAVIALFVAGAAAGELIEPLGGRLGQSLILAIEALLLGAGAALQWPGVAVPGVNALFPLVFAMGLQNATLHRAGGISISLTYVTGTLVHVGRSVAGVIGGKGGWRNLTKYLALWLSLATGACLGALALSISSFVAISAAAALAASLALLTMSLQR